MKIRARLLGTGGSFGIPGIGCDCPVCLSTHKKNKRLRTSAFIEAGGKKILIDASPDIRQVALLYKMDKIDQVLLSHFHEDHIGGLNDLRPFFMKNDKPIPLYLSEETLREISSRFGYLLDRFEIKLLEDETGSIDGFRYFTYSQGPTCVTGFRFGDFAYLTDIKVYPEAIFHELKGVKILVLGAIHEEGTGMHFSFPEAIEFGKRSKSPRIIFTHLAHEVDHEQGSAMLPSGFELGYDGMVFDV